MSDTRKIIKVFLASPGDLPEERRAAKAAVDEINKLWSDTLGYQVDLIGWEDTVSRFGRPQALINQELDRCELFIGMMWKKWGTPPTLSGPFTSGFEEEFELSVRKRRKEGKPEISLLFKEVEADRLNDPGDELKKVLSFKDKIIAEKEILFETFKDPAQLESKIRACVTKYLQNLLVEEANKASGASQVQPPSQPDSEGPDKEARNPLSKEGAQFLRDFVAKTERDPEEEPIQAVEVARVRLLANIIAKSGNDEEGVGVHDANILFDHRLQLALSLREMTGLFRVGLEHFANENIPLWYWFSAIEGFDRKFLPLYAVIGPSKRRIGALAAMRMLDEPLPASKETPLERPEFLENWLGDKSPNDLRIAALGYLADCGIESDLPVLKQEFDRGNYQTTGPAIDAIIRINLRYSRSNALKALYELQPSSINQQVVSAVFSNPDQFSASLLKEGLVHPNEHVRAIVAKLLRARGELPSELAEPLLGDSNAQVRFEALQALVEAGRSFSDSEAKQILVKPTGRGLLFSPGGSVYDREGELNWKAYRAGNKSKMSDAELEKEIADASILDEGEARFELDARRFAERAGALRAAVSDAFRSEIAEGIRVLEPKVSVDTLQKVKSLADPLSRGFTRKGLNVICEQMNSADLGLVRRTLVDGNVDYSDGDIEFLKKRGEWEDIRLILSVIERPSPGSTLLGSGNPAKYRAAARAIYKMGRERYNELLELEMPSQVLLHLIVEASEKAFRSLEDSQVLRLLFMNDDGVRKATSLKCIRSMTKKRREKIFDAYLSADQSRYYNVIFWLDMGLSVPRDRALQAAEKVTGSTWRSAPEFG
jgi:hypothetical protein